MGQSVVKCMRGILFAWMRQSEKVESFKANQCPKHALHLKFDLHSGLANDFEYPHLQIDVVSLYLIFLSNFITSGLDIIYCMDEVTFIQNLVYYVERAYRTPDYGNWEPKSISMTTDELQNLHFLQQQQQQHNNHQHSPVQNPTSAIDNNNDGQPQFQLPTIKSLFDQQPFSNSSTPHRNLFESADHQHHHRQSTSNSNHLNNHLNNGGNNNNKQNLFNNCINCDSNHESQSLEIHATSIGMAKSALEAINGCNLFGGRGANWSIIYSDIDAHSRNRSIFETLLPRESRSKNTDSYLLATISWPCFATSDPVLYNSTKSKILRKLKGRYGLKRFLRDPYGTVLGLPNLQTGGGQQQLQDNNMETPASPFVANNLDTSAASSISLSVQRETSFSSTTSHDSASNASMLDAVGSSTNQISSHKAKQRKSSYWQRKTNSINSNSHNFVNKLEREYSLDSTCSLSPGQQQQQQNQQNQRQEVSSSKMSKQFEHIESEWPLFVCFLIIDGIFKQNAEQVLENEKLLYERLLIEEPNGDYLMPKYYYVPMDLIKDEKVTPESVDRVPSLEGSSSERLYLTGQAILLITRLLLHKLVHPNELDPLRRHLPAHDRPKQAIGRYSSFQSKSPDLVVQTVLIAESIRLQAMMANYGIQTQTPREVEPVQIWSSAQLVKVYEYLGVNQKLGLKGRPARPIGALGTSKLYRICGQTIICYPLIFEVSDFYLAQDMLLLIDDIQNELNFIGRYWRMSGRPTVCIIIREEHLRDVHFRDLLDLLVQFKNGQLKKSGLRIKTGRLQNLISSSCIEHLDFLHLLPHEHLPQFESFRQLVESPKHSLLLGATAPILEVATDSANATNNQQGRHHLLASQSQSSQQLTQSHFARGRRTLNLARYTNQLQQQQQQYEADKQLIQPSGSIDDHDNDDDDLLEHQKQLQQHPPNKSRRVLLSSASSNNLQAIDEISNAQMSAMDTMTTTTMTNETRRAKTGDQNEHENRDHRSHHDHPMAGQQAANREDSFDGSNDDNDDVDDDDDEDDYLSTDNQSSFNGTNNLTGGCTTGYSYQQQHRPSVDYYECYKEAPTWPTLVELLRGCGSNGELSGQSQLLALLWEREGPKYCLDEQSVEQRLERVSSLACQSRNWSVVRYCSAVLRRSVESLSPWLTSILVNGKQISLGQGANEKIINNPLTPTEIHTLIYSTVSTKNPCDAVLQQEIALYIGRLISTRPECFEGILTIRVANFMSAMRSYLAIRNQERRQKLAAAAAVVKKQQQQDEEEIKNIREKEEQVDQQQQQLLDLRIKAHEEEGTGQQSSSSSPPPPASDEVQPPEQPPVDISVTKCEGLKSALKPSKRNYNQQNQSQNQSQSATTCCVARPLESLSPSEVRRLLVRVLSDDSSLPLSDRRQITGELCRVPRDFYDKVWSLLHFTNIGIVIGDRMLRSVPILTNMTQDDLNFALKVESILSLIDDPKLRQINVEFLMALHVVFERNPELRFDTEPLDLNQIIKLSLDKFRQDSQRSDYGLREFYGMTTQMAMLYTVRTVFDCLLPSKFKSSAMDHTGSTAGVVAP